MNRNHIIAIICFLLGAVMLVLHFSSSSIESEEDKNQALGINLALRQTAHRLYKAASDSTTVIPPVEQISTTHFSLKLNKVFNYDTLPFLLNEAFSDFNLTQDYVVTVKNCETNDIILGYNKLAFENHEPTCAGRERLTKCSIIGLAFAPRKKTNNTPYLPAFIIFFLAGIVTLLVRRPTNKQIPEITTSLNSSSNGSIHLANSNFSPGNLTINVNNTAKTLTFRESKLLMYFFNNPNQVLNREDIKQHVWGDEGIIVGRSVDVFVSRLRKILKEDERVEIKNIHGVGYRLDVK